MKNQYLKIAIVGYGSQAKAWSQNLKDRNQHVCILLRENSTSIAEVQKSGLDFQLLQETKGGFDFIVLLTPDHSHFEILQTYFNQDSKLKIVLAHGYSYAKHNFNELFTNFDFYLLAPKAIASELRTNFLQKDPLYAAISPNVHEKDLFYQLIESLGITTTIECSFAEECYADLFSEQSLLCGLIPYAAKRSYDKLVEKGINPELAYIECWHEVKLIAETMVKLGPAKTFELISPNALLGAKLYSEKFFSKEYDNLLESSYQDIQKGEFFRYEETIDKLEAFRTVHNDWKNSHIEGTFHKLRRHSEKTEH